MKMELTEKSPRGLWIWSSSPTKAVTVQVATMFGTSQRCLGIRFAKNSKEGSVSLKPIIVAEDMLAWLVAVDLVGHLSKLPDEVEVTKSDVLKCLHEFSRKYGWDGAVAKLTVTSEALKRRQGRDKEKDDGQAIGTGTAADDPPAGEVPGSGGHAGGDHQELQGQLEERNHVPVCQGSDN